MFVVLFRWFLLQRHKIRMIRCEFQGFSILLELCFRICYVLKGPIWSKDLRFVLFVVLFHWVFNPKLWNCIDTLWISRFLRFFILRNWIIHNYICIQIYRCFSISKLRFIYSTLSRKYTKKHAFFCMPFHSVSENKQKCNVLEHVVKTTQIEIFKKWGGDDWRPIYIYIYTVYLYIYKHTYIYIYK